MSDTGVLAFIGVGCAIFGAITAYLIYNFVQQEKAEYYKYKLRKEKMKQDPNNYDYVAPKEKKKKLSGPVVDANEEEPTSRTNSNGVPIPVPAPLLAPVHLPPVPNGNATPPVSAPADGQPQQQSNNGNSNNHVDDPLISDTTAAAAALGAGAAAGGVAAFTTYQVARSYPEPEPSQQQTKNKKDKKPKRRGSVKKVSEDDFDDYRNFSPTVLPPPKGVPPPRANYTGTGGNESPPESDDVQSVAVETGSSRRGDRGMELPQVSVVTRDGLSF